MKITIDVSVGEAIDKLSILMIKSKNISDKEKLTYILSELDEIKNALRDIEYVDFLNQLINVNSQMWDVNDRRKILISNHEFTEEYLELTKRESLLNDLRFKIKNQINHNFNSEIKEQKSYI